MAVTAEGSMPLVNRLPHDPQPLPPAITTYHFKIPICLKLFFHLLLPSKWLCFKKFPP